MESGTILTRQERLRYVYLLFLLHNKLLKLSGLKNNFFNFVDQLDSSIKLTG